MIVEKNINELMNEVSMELKDEISQRKFEIICKIYMELEKENKELKSKISDIRDVFKYDTDYPNIRLANICKIIMG